MLEIIPSEENYVSLFPWGKEENRRKYEKDKLEKDTVKDSEKQKLFIRQTCLKEPG
jgi:hypothetical protein